MIFVNGFKKTFRTSAFKKPARGAENISFEVTKGEIHGFLGPNGAGKSTTIKALLGLIRPDAGELKLFDEPISSGQWRQRVGYMPEHPNFYDYLTGLEMVSWFGRLAGMNKTDARAAAQKELERVGLSHAMNRRIRTYSKGMIQRAGLAQALLGHPELLILDEPMTGLDPIGRKEIRELILSLKDEGKTVFYSTHILPDIEMTCDRVTIVHEGITQRSGHLDEILDETTRGVTVGVEGLSPERVKELQSNNLSPMTSGPQVTIEVSDLEAAQQLLAKLMEDSAVKLTRFEPHRDDLETIFVRSLQSSSNSSQANEADAP